MGQKKPTGEAERLVQIANDIEELENGRLALLEKIEGVRTRLLAAAQRTSTLKASVEMLLDHAATTVATAAELRVIESEARELGFAVTRMNSDSLGLLFEADSLDQSFTETEDEMERLLSALIEGKTRKLRGH